MKSEEQNMKEFKFFLLMSKAGYANSYYPTMDILFEDIIKLKEELDIAKNDNKILFKHLREASAEAERLTKAGDHLRDVLASKSLSYEAGNAAFEWENAKNFNNSK